MYERAFDHAWVRDNMPGQELRRQKKAFWKGAMRTGIVAAVVLAVVSSLAVVAFRNADRAVRAEALAKSQRDQARYDAYVASMRTLPSIWKTANLESMQTVLNSTRDNPARGWEWEFWNHLANDALAFTSETAGGFMPKVSPDGRTFASRSGGTLKLLDTDDLRVTKSLSVPGRSYFVNWTPGGNLVTQTSGPSGAGILINAATGRVVKKLGSYCFTMTPQGVSPDGRFTICADSQLGVKVYDLQAGTLRPLPIHANLFNLGYPAAAFSRDGEQCALAVFEPAARSRSARVGIAIFRTSDWRKTRFFPISDHVFALAYSADGKSLAAGSSGGMVYLLKPETGEQAARTRADAEEVYQASFSSDGRSLATSGADRVVKLFRVGPKSLDLTAKVPGANWVEYLPGGRIAASYRNLRVVDPSRYVVDVEQIYDACRSAEI
ncbi:WD40 repeat domain-containing protein [bacterium]|nr:MAG: WD40 repeat domain-containing protein [bacterium]